MTSVPTRRWFRFSLRTVFVVLTVVAVWLGWNLNVVHRRQELLAKLVVGECYTFINYGDGRIRFPDDYVAASAAGYRVAYSRHSRTARFGVSALRRLLGDTPLWSIAYRPGPDPEQVQRLFPEANIVVFSADIK